MSNASDAGVLASAQAQILAGRGLSAEAGAHLMSLGPSAVHIDTALTNLLLRYDNREYIADRALPVVTVQKRSDKIFEFPVATMQTLAGVNLASSRAEPGEITYSVTSSTSYSVIDYGLRDFIGADEESNADAPLQPRLVAAEILMNYLMLAREKRVADTVFSSGNYGSNTSALSGSNRWDVSTGTPVQNIFDAITTPFVRPNVLIMGEQVWQKFRNSTDVTRFVTSRASTAMGAVPFFVDQEMVAQAFGLDAVLVGRAKYNSAREGATASSSYLWGKSAALIRVEAAPNARKSSCFGYTFRYGGISNQVIPDLMRGVRGGVFLKVTHSDAEQTLAASNAGYLYTTVVS